MTIVVLGGVTSLRGAMLSTAFIGLLKCGVLNPNTQILASGAGVLVILYVAPGGVAQWFYGARDGMLRWIADRRGIIVPSLLADSRDAVAAADLDTANALQVAAQAPSFSTEEVGSPA